MKGHFLKSLAFLLTGALLFSIAGCGKKAGNTTTDPTTTPENTPTVTQGITPVNTIEDYSGTTLASIGKIKSKAVLWEKDLTLRYDEKVNMNVVHFEGGEGYLELPSDIFEEAGEGFTIAFLVRADATVNSNARIFQANLCGYSVGDTNWMDAPEISLSADGTVRIFAGGRTISGVYNPIATYNNGGSNDDKAYAEPYGHKTRYTGRTSGFSAEEWTEVALSVAPDGFKVFANGIELSYTEEAAEEGNIKSTLEYLFGKYTGGSNLLLKYINISFGNSVYSDSNDFKGDVSNIRFYNKALTAEELATNEADYHWSVEADSVGYNEKTTNYTADLTRYQGIGSLESQLELKSPKEKLSFCLLKDEKGGFYYNVTSKGQVLVENSRLGFAFSAGDLSEGLAVTDVKTVEINESYDTITGSGATAENHCMEARVTLANDKGSFVLVIRAYEDGVAYKYKEVKFGEAEKLTVKDELSQIIFTPNITCWSFALNGTYEGEFLKRSANSLRALAQTLTTPTLVQSGEFYILVTEAQVFNNDGQYCASGLKTDSGSLALDWTFGLKRDPAHESTGELDQPGHLTIQTVNTVNGFDTPWRVLVISDDINAFATSDIISNLNPAADPELFADTSWIKPGKVAWSWWSADGSQGNYRTHIKYIDFAADNGWDYVCLDANWRNFESRIGEMCTYAADKNVGLFVWVNYRDIKTVSDMEKLFSKWAEAGVVGLKTDYFESDDCNVMLTMQRVAEVAAKYHLMVLYHGCVRPGGEYRTYPNILTMEAVLGEENHKWGKLPTIYNSLMFPFTRNICGSMDYTPTALAIANSEATNGFELAMTVVYESGLQHLAYSINGYKTYNGLSFINHVPTSWDQSLMISGLPGEYATFARRNGEEWFLGAMTNSARNESIKLDFLGEGNYNAYIFSDSEDSEKLVITKKTVTAADTLDLKLPYAGGATVIFTKNEYADISLGQGGDSQNEAEVSNYIKYEAESEANTLKGAAVVAGAELCSGKKKVGYVGNGAANTLTFNRVTVSEAGEYEVILYYISGESRKVSVSVNGAEATVLTNLNSGDWSTVESISFTLKLTAGDNTITLSNSSYYAPDIDCIEVSKKKK